MEVTLFPYGSDHRTYLTIEKHKKCLKTDKHQILTAEIKLLVKTL